MQANSVENTAIPEGFVALADAVPGVVLEPRYAGSNNFTGAPVPGYEHGVLLLSRPAAEVLAAVAESLAPVGLGLKILDAYRPQRANRWLLRTVMERHGFVPQAEEWWHFTLRDEPWPDTIFDFVAR